MLLKLGDHIRACYERAVGAEERAKAEPAANAYYLEMARCWTQLARSYEFVESLERFLLDIDKLGATKADAWQPIASAPYDRDLRLAVLDADGNAHALIFPSRRILGGWIKSQTRHRIQIDPTHWQEWTEPT